MQEDRGARFESNFTSALSLARRMHSEILGKRNFYGGEETMKKSTRLVLVAAAMCLVAVAAQAKPNLTGEWKMNIAKSEFGMMPAPTSAVWKITHNDPELKVASTQVSERGEFTSNNAYTTDGKECVNKGRMGELKSTLKWDGDTLVIESKAEFGGNAVTITDKWTLSEDGKILTVNRHFASTQGEGDVRQVYEKQ